MGVKIVAVLSLLPLYRSFNMASTLESVNRDHHIYKQIWWLLVRDILTLEQEEGNNHDNSLRGCYYLKLPVEKSVVQPFSSFFVLLGPF